MLHTEGPQFATALEQHVKAYEVDIMNLQRVDKLEEMPTPKELAARGERWGPYRTYASLYLWRIADAAVANKPPAKRSQG